MRGIDALGSGEAQQTMDRGPYRTLVNKVEQKDLIVVAQNGNFCVHTLVGEEHVFLVKGDHMSTASDSTTFQLIQERQPARTDEQGVLRAQKLHALFGTRCPNNRIDHHPVGSAGHQFMTGVRKTLVRHPVVKTKDGLFFCDRGTKPVQRIGMAIPRRHREGKLDRWTKARQ